MDASNVGHDGNGSLLGCILSIIALIVSERSRIVEKHIPPLIMDITQWLAWVLTIILAGFTIYYKFLKPKVK